MKKIITLFLLLAWGQSTSAQVRQTCLHLDGTGGNFIKLVAASLSAGRQLTFPDPGADASVILSKSSGGQSITGGLSVTGGITVAGGYSLPTNAGNNGDVLTSNGLGSSSWHAPTAGSGLSSYGHTYELATLADATVVGGADVPFSNNGPLTGITHTAGTTTITVPTTGVYEIDYSVNITAGVGSAIAIAVNGTVDASTPITALIATGQINGAAMLTLAAGDVVTLRNNSAIPLVMNLAPGVGAYMLIKKLN